MHELLVNCLFKLAQEKVWLGELTAITIAVDLGRKATKQTNKQTKRPKMMTVYPTIYLWKKSDIINYVILEDMWLYETLQSSNWIQNKVH